MPELSRRGGWEGTERSCPRRPGRPAHPAGPNSRIQRTRCSRKCGDCPHQVSYCGFIFGAIEAELRTMGRKQRMTIAKLARRRSRSRNTSVGAHSPSLRRPSTAAIPENPAIAIAISATVVRASWGSIGTTSTIKHSAPRHRPPRSLGTQVQSRTLPRTDWNSLGQEGPLPIHQVPHSTFKRSIYLERPSLSCNSGGRLNCWIWPA